MIPLGPVIFVHALGLKQLAPARSEVPLRNLLFICVRICFFPFRLSSSVYLAPRARLTLLAEYVGIAGFFQYVVAFGYLQVCNAECRLYAYRTSFI